MKWSQQNVTRKGRHQKKKFNYQKWSRYIIQGWEEWTKPINQRNHMRLTIGKKNFLPCENSHIILIDTCRYKKKCYLRIFDNFLDTMLVNSYVIHKKLHGDILSHLDFRRQVVHGLIGSFSSRKRDTFTTCANKSRNKSKALQPSSVPMHIPVLLAKRRRCQQCAAAGKEQRTNIICETFQVPLCLQSGRNSFKDFH